MENSNIELIRGHMDTIILRTLQQGDKYGLEMLNEIKSLSDELYSLKQPTLYSSLKRLEKQGYISSYPGSETKGANRTYYKLTDQGCNMLETDQKQWEFSRTIIDKLLSNKEFDKESIPPFNTSEFRPSTKRERKEVEPTIIIKYIEVEKKVFIKEDATDLVAEEFEPETITIINDKANDDTSNSVSDNNNEVYTQFYEKPKCEDTYEEYSCDQEIASDEITDNNSTLDNNSSSDYDTTSECPPDLDDENDVNTVNSFNDTMIDNYTDSDFDEIMAKDLNTNNEYQFYNDISQPSDNNSTQDNLHNETYSAEYDFKAENYSSTPNINAEYKQYDYDEVQPGKLNDNIFMKASKEEELYIDDCVDYMDTFGDMYSTDKIIEINEDTVTAPKNDYKQYNYAEKTYTSDKNMSEMTMTDLKSVLASKNIKLKPHYRNSTINFYSGKFYYSNSVLRDWSLIMYGLFISFLLISYFSASTKGINLYWTLGFMGIGSVLPISCFLLWKYSPVRRKRTSFVAGNTLLVSCIILIALTVVIILVAFFIIKIDTSNPVELIPTIIIPLVSLLLMPIGVGVYSILYKCKRYHVG